MNSESILEDAVAESLKINHQEVRYLKSTTKRRIPIVPDSLSTIPQKSGFVQRPDH